MVLGINQKSWLSILMRENIIVNLQIFLLFFIFLPINEQSWDHEFLLDSLTSQLPPLIFQHGNYGPSSGLSQPLLSNPSSQQCHIVVMLIEKIQKQKMYKAGGWAIISMLKHQESDFE